MKPKKTSVIRTHPARDPQGITVVLKARSENLYLLREVLSVFLKVFVPHPLTEDIHFSTELALQEASSNVIRYAFPEGSDERFEVTFRYTGDTLELELVDEGKPYNPEWAREPHFEEFSEGGYGLHLIQQTMDSVRYRREEGRNILLLIKNLSR